MAPLRAPGDPDPMIAMLLAAGRGERMQPLTRSLAKPAIPLLGDPMIVHGLRALADHGIRSAVVNVHHRPEDVSRAIGDGPALGLERVHYSKETECLLGTAGGLRHAATWLRGAGTIVIRNGDFLADIDFASALAAHRASKLPATMVLVAPRAGYTPVPVSTDGRVIGFGANVDTVGQSLSGRYTFTGLHFLEESWLDRIPEGPCDILSVIYSGLAAEGRLGAFVHRGYWWEFGTPEAYFEGVLRLLDLPADERARVLRHDPVFAIGGVPIAAGVGARWADGVEWVGRVAVGAGCEIANRARLSDVVLMPGCSVEGRASLHRCVVGPRTRIARGARFHDVLICHDDGGSEPLPPETTRIDDLLVRPLHVDEP